MWSLGATEGNLVLRHGVCAESTLQAGEEEQALSGTETFLELHMVLLEEPPDSLNCERGRLESPQAPDATRHSPDLQKPVLKVSETQKYPPMQ